MNPEEGLFCNFGEAHPLASQVGIEVFKGAEKLKDIKRAVSIFGGSRAGIDGWAYINSYNLAYSLALKDISVISGGGPGVMEAANRGVKDAKNNNAKAIGLNISIEAELNDRRFQDISIDFDHFPARKIIFCQHSDAFVVAPGGFGTLDELFEVLTLIQTKKLNPVPVILMGKKFWSGLTEWLNGKALKNGYLTQQNADLLSLADGWEEVLKILENKKIV